MTVTNLDWLLECDPAGRETILAMVEKGEESDLGEPWCRKRCLDRYTCGVCRREWLEANNEGAERVCGDPERGGEWSPDYDFVRSYAEEVVRSNCCGASALSPWQSLIVAGTVAYAEETWSGFREDWLRRWGSEESLPMWGEMTDAQRNHAIASAAYEHFVADTDLQSDRFAERMLTYDPADMLLR